MAIVTTTAAEGAVYTWLKSNSGLEIVNTSATMSTIVMRYVYDFGKLADVDEQTALNKAMNNSSDDIPMFDALVNLETYLATL